jgi:hypothetical protein
MTTRTTSAEAWAVIKANGLLSKRQAEVFEALVHAGPVTGNELGLRMALSKRINTNVITRLGELRDRGIVDEAGFRVCEVTGKKVIVWQANGQTNPIPLKKISEVARLRHENYELKKEIDIVRAQLNQQRAG